MFYFDPRQRQSEKQASRDQDERDLQAGVVSREELRHNNGAFSALNLAGSRIRISNRAA
jgi:hypothetical protein